MFKGFTWAKFLGDITTVVAIASSGLLGIKVATIGAAFGVAVRAIASLVTTIQTGKATDANGATISSK